MADRYWLSSERHKWHHTEWLPTALVWTMREYDRVDDRARSNIEDLKRDLTARGFLDPLILDYQEDERTVLLTEGNHRLAAARELRLMQVPVRVMLKSYPWGKNPYRRMPVRVPGIEPNEHDYIPQNMFPSQIGLPGTPVTAEAHTRGAFGSLTLRQPLAKFTIVYGHSCSACHKVLPKIDELEHKLRNVAFERIDIEKDGVQLDYPVTLIPHFRFEHKGKTYAADLTREDLDGTLDSLLYWVGACAAGREKPEK